MNTKANFKYYYTYIITKINFVSNNRVPYTRNISRKTKLKTI